ncbi:MAG: hypothetical protein ACM65L_20370 [Microcoleus sp.]
MTPSRSETPYKSEGTTYGSVLKSQIEIEEDIASFGLVYMAKIG